MDREQAIERLRMHVCEEILNFGESKREGPDLTLTLDRIFTALELAGYRLQEPPTKELVEDGFGSQAPAICPTYGNKSVYVCRPGDFRCGVCYDGNSPDDYKMTKPAPKSPEKLREEVAQLIRDYTNQQIRTLNHRGIPYRPLTPTGQADKILSRITLSQPELKELDYLGVVKWAEEHGYHECDLNPPGLWTGGINRLAQRDYDQQQIER